MSQVCDTCQIDKDVSCYYMVYGIKYKKKCKECISAANKRIKKPFGFAALPSTTQESIKLQLQNRRVKLKDIADEHGINYATFGYWVRNNKIQ